MVVRDLATSRAAETADRLTADAGVRIDLLRWEELDESFRARVAREGEQLA